MRFFVKGIYAPIIDDYVNNDDDDNNDDDSGGDGDDGCMIQNVMILEQQDYEYISLKQNIFAMNRRKSKKITKHITSFFQITKHITSFFKLLSILQVFPNY